MYSKNNFIEEAKFSFAQTAVWQIGWEFNFFSITTVFHTRIFNKIPGT